MKLLKTILPLGALLALGGCFREEFAICPDGEGGVRLGFSLIDDDGSDVFRDNISAVNVIIFDQYGYYIMQHRVESNDFQQFQGATLTLDPGSYKAVCWGNVNDNTSVGQQGNDDVYVTYNGIDSQGRTLGDADRIFYGPVDGMGSSRGADTYNSFEFEVTESGAQETIYFGYAHRVLDINVKGFTDSNGSKSLPQVRISGLPMGLGLGCKVLTDAAGNMLTVITQKDTEWITQSGSDYAWAEFSAFYFDLDADIEISIIDPLSGASVYDTSLAHVLEQTGITDETQISIPLVIEFIDGEVSITLPGWSTQNPGIEF